MSELSYSVELFLFYFTVTDPFLFFSFTSLQSLASHHSGEGKDEKKEHFPVFKRQPSLRTCWIICLLLEHSLNCHAKEPSFTGKRGKEIIRQYHMIQDAKMQNIRFK